MLVKEIAEKNCELRHMRGEDLQELTWEELQKLEKSVEGSLRRIVEEKGEKGIKEINALKTKVTFLTSDILRLEEQLVEENQRLKQQVMDLSAGQRRLLEQDKSSDSLVTNISSMISSADPRQDYDSSCAFLKLGLACYTHFHTNNFF
ncbi:hypothetical protein OIU77_002875 [Salix suchowensis]|uniref:K-box domain-containing protein n=1 Tax=Salix suchowensis TaxID=1278906 RepID=A0ABQ9AZZ7_9ROSI|nr:hypothetical protein OIU77_002875 [Salix suchowensis]